MKAKQKSIVIYSNGKTSKTSQTSTYNYNKINVSPTISLGVDYIINSMSNLRIEPTFRYGLLKTIDKPITEYLWNTGINISYYFKI